jgi:hypothetical protein
MAAIHRPRVAIVLVESSANPPIGIDRLMTELRTTSAHAITQLESEEPGAFMLRALSELASIESAGAPMTLGVVACNDRMGGALSPGARMRRTQASRSVVRLLEQIGDRRPDRHQDEKDRGELPSEQHGYEQP